MTTIPRTDMPTTVDTATGGRRRRTRSKTKWAGILFVLPAAVYVAVYQLFPVIYGFILSFTKYNPLSRTGPSFVGGRNYTELFTDGNFGRALLVTGKYVLMVLPILLIVALVLAILANQTFKGIGIFRSALYVPHIVSLTVVAVIWMWMYSPNGLFNDWLSSLGLPSQSWLLGENTAMPAVAAMRIWKALGSNMVLLLAGLQTIPKELYEAAETDGAGWWARLVHVTLPGLRPMLTYVIAMDVIGLAQGFVELFVLTGGGPLSSTTTVNYLVYNEGFEYSSFGSASAMAFVLFAFVAGFSILLIHSMSRRDS